MLHVTYEASNRMCSTASLRIIQLKRNNNINKISGLLEKNVKKSVKIAYRLYPLYKPQ